MNDDDECDDECDDEMMTVLFSEDRAEERRAKRRSCKACRLRSIADTRRLKSIARHVQAHRAQLHTSAG